MAIADRIFPHWATATKGRQTIGPETIHRVQTANGITVLVRPNPSAPVVVLEGCLRAGSVDESAEKAGLASFAASLVSRGSAHYDFDRYNETVESVGASIGVDGGTHVTNFGSESLVEDFPLMVELLADILRRPTFPSGSYRTGAWTVAGAFAGTRTEHAQRLLPAL